MQASLQNLPGPVHSGPTLCTLGQATQLHEFGGCSQCVHAPGTLYATKSIFAKAVFLVGTPTVQSFTRSLLGTLAIGFKAFSIGLDWRDCLSAHKPLLAQERSVKLLTQTV